ncbi:hypothetical protein GY21_12970 [Cryobacterium roopkundense]|uniref:DUF916 domain-containing protein n=1 Tax=Cryobacterium roopkundense TaxID=1001240 RepID=A0A099J5M6_9MICO|nr:hypothetical protein GY21_12970 [Cryobacterium roopkundense]
MLVAVLALSPFLISLGAVPAAAVDDGTLGIRPELESDFFHINLAPGAAIDANAIVSNHSAEPVTLLNYAVDGQSTPQGAFALAAQADTRTGVGAWVSLGADSITIPANSQLTVPFRLSVPENATPGDYAGGVIIESAAVQGETTSSGGDAALRLDVIQRQGVRIYLTVAGTAVSTLTHGDLGWTRGGESVTFTLPITNTGNTILYPTATLDVSGWIGATATLDFATPESILPGATLDLEATLTPAPFLQAGNAEAALSSEAGDELVGTSFVYAPWWFILVMVLALAALVFGIWRALLFVRRARRAFAQVAVSTSVPAEELAPPS